MIRKVKNSSQQEIGEIEFLENEIKIRHYKKPLLTITDKQLIDKIQQEISDEITLLILYDEYYLLIGEIACLYNRPYSWANRMIKQIPYVTKPHEGRRNACYGKVFTQEHLEHMSQGLKKHYETHTSWAKGKSKSQEQKDKISATLKRRYAAKEIVNDPQKFRDAWARGCYDHTDFKRGIGGYFFSIKNNKKINFRSLLELYYFIQLEQDETVEKYLYEPFRIPCDNGTIYTPDLLINDNLVVEIKSRKFVQNQPEINERFLYKNQQAEKYCKEKGYIFKVVYDDEIGFDNRCMKREIQNHPELIEKYQIKFFDEKRVGLKK